MEKSKDARPSSNSINLSVDKKRRDFLKASAMSAGGFIVGFYAPGAFADAVAEAAKHVPSLAATVGPVTYPPNAFIKITPDNSITLIINKLEMGQGVNTSLAQLIAEELECDWTKIKCTSAPINPVYNHTQRPMQMTGGSSALNSSYDQHRTIGAGMRIMLIEAAANKWGVPAKECHAENSFVIHPKKGKLSYGELAELANQQTFPDKIKLKDPKNFKVIGKSMSRVDAQDKSTGAGIFGIDVKIPDMTYAMIARSPVRGGKLVSVNSAKAEAVAGVTDVVRFGDSVAVLAKNTWIAKKGRDLLEIKWDFQGKNGFSDESLMSDFKNELKNPGVPVEKRGDPDEALKKSASKFVAEYEFPYLAHAPMEPMNCTIAFDGQKAEIWAGHQMPTMDRMAAAKVLEIAPEKIEIHTTYAGGSFGRRANKSSDYVVEAAALAKAIRKPVKIVWTREDDMTGGYYRPMNFHRVEVGFDGKNNIQGWRHNVVGQSVVGDSVLEAMIVKNGVESTVVEGVAGTAYIIKDFSVDLHRPKPNVSTLWWRSVGHTHTAYVMETMIDDVAYRANKDPMKFRKELLKDSPRHMAVLKLLEQKSNWGKPMKKGRALGLAIHDSFKSVVGHVVEVSYEDNAVKVHHITSAVHCGQVVNPEGAKNQVEGAIVYGLSAALHGEIKIDDGKIMTTNFHNYQVVRAGEMPTIEVHFVASHDTPTGLGEPAVPPTAPAIANGLFKLTGKRIHKLPFAKGLA